MGPPNFGRAEPDHAFAARPCVHMPVPAAVAAQPRLKTPITLSGSAKPPSPFGFGWFSLVIGFIRNAFSNTKETDIVPAQRPNDLATGMLCFTIRGVDAEAKLQIWQARGVEGRASRQKSLRSHRYERCPNSPPIKRCRIFAQWPAHCLLCGQTIKAACRATAATSRLSCRVVCMS